MGHGYVVELGEGNAVQTVGYVEDTFAHIVKLEVGLQLVLGEVELLGLGLLEVVPPVGCSQLTVDSLSLGDGIHVGQLTLCGLQGRSPELVEETVDSLWGLGHAVLKNELGVVVVAHDLGLLVIEVDHLHDDGLVVIGIIVVAAIQITVEQSGAEFPVIVKLKEWHYTGVIQAKGPHTVHAFLFRTLGSSIHSCLRQSCQILCILNHQRKIRRFLQHVLFELQL